MEDKLSSADFNTDVREYLNKITSTTDFTDINGIEVSNCTISGNDGVGLWLELDLADLTNNIVAFNSGIFLDNILKERNIAGIKPRFSITIAGKVK